MRRPMAMIDIRTNIWFSHQRLKLLIHPIKWIVHLQRVKSIRLRPSLTSLDKIRSTSKFSSGFTVASFMDKNCIIYLYKTNSPKNHNIMELKLWGRVVIIKISLNINYPVKWLLNPSYYFTIVFPFFIFPLAWSMCTVQNRSSLNFEY